MMRSVIRILAWLGAACLAAGLFAEPATNAPGNPAGSDETPTAPALLARVRAAMPRETLTIKGKLMRGGRIGRLEQAFRIEALLEWGQDPPFARYTLADMFGAPLARLTVIYRPEKPAEFAYEQGQPFKAAPTPDLNQPIENTELTWNDLSLAFLWWPGGKVVGRDNIIGRDCYVVELPAPHQPGSTPAKPSITPATPATTTAPPSATTARSPAEAIASIRLWIDDHLIVVIQIEEYDAEGKVIRRLGVKKIKKIGDVWMIKNMDIRRYPSLHRTQIRIEEVISATATNAPEMELGE